MRSLIYIIIVTGLALGGVLDALSGQWKLATVAWLFSTANAVIFFWK